VQLFLVTDTAQLRVSSLRAVAACEQLSGMAACYFAGVAFCKTYGSFVRASIF